MKISSAGNNHIIPKGTFKLKEKDLFEIIDTVQINNQLSLSDEGGQLEKLREMAEKNKAASICKIKDSHKELKSSPLYMAMIGAPGAGKGTQGRELAKKYDIPHISAGKLLREIATKDTPLAKEVQSYISRGELVPNDMINAVIEERLKRPDCEKGFILDGFPRTGESAKALDEILAKQGKKLGNVIELKISREECLKRLTARGRHDDKPHIINHRYDIYLEEAEKIRGNFTGKEDLYRGINGEGPVEVIGEGLTSMVDEQMVKVRLKKIISEQ